MRFASIYCVLLFADSCANGGVGQIPPKAELPPAVEETPHGVGINIHLKGSNEVIKTWHRDKTEAELRQSLAADFADDGIAVLQVGDGKAVEVRQDDVAFCKYKEMSSVMWILDAGNL